MKTWEIQEQFGLEHLRRVERDMAEPADNEVLVKITAVSLNYRDLMMVEGRYNPKLSLPLVPVSDGVGRIVACGKSVRQFKTGDRVCGMLVQGWEQGKPSKVLMRQHTLGGPLDGMLQEYRTLPAEGVAKVPDYLSDEQACTLPCAALTAWSALHNLSTLSENDTVLCQGSGGVSVFALLFAVAAGARVIAMSSSAEKEQQLHALGAKSTINYRLEPNWVSKIKELTGGEGVDHIIEVGGSQTIENSLASIKEGGTISIIGVLSGSKASHSLIPILMKQVTLQGVFVGHKKSFLDMLDFMEQKKIEPVIDTVYSFDKSIEAFHHLKKATHFGKIVVRIHE
ncbi:MAG: NAD(P)-dependent alcohol dehydrogenase [Myxococcales bacterium]|nr:MAG: NAD(P)-dependent alcohol dehydrogenase [Myxococcales bacterium]